MKHRIVRDFIIYFIGFELSRNYIKLNGAEQNREKLHLIEMNLIKKDSIIMLRHIDLYYHLHFISSFQMKFNTNFPLSYSHSTINWSTQKTSSYWTIIIIIMTRNLSDPRSSALHSLKVHKFFKRISTILILLIMSRCNFPAIECFFIFIYVSI